MTEAQALSRQPTIRKTSERVTWEQLQWMLTFLPSISTNDKSFHCTVLTTQCQVRGIAKKMMAANFPTHLLSAPFCALQISTEKSKEVGKPRQWCSFVYIIMSAKDQLLLLPDQVAGWYNFGYFLHTANILSFSSLYVSVFHCSIISIKLLILILMTFWVWLRNVVKPNKKSVTQS